MVGSINRERESPQTTLNEVTCVLCGCFDILTLEEGTTYFYVHDRRSLPNWIARARRRNQTTQTIRCRNDRPQYEIVPYLCAVITEQQQQQQQS